VSADASALALGLSPGLALADAQARVPALDVATHDPSADHALAERLAGWCERYTPLVALDPPDGLILDITGCAHLFGGEALLLADLCAWMKGFGYEARGAVAGTPDASRALARYGGAQVVVPSGEDDAAVRPLPIAALGIDTSLVRGLARVGLKRIGDLAERPRTPLAARFGEDLLARIDRALGRTDIKITPRRPLPPSIAERHFPEPVTNEEQIRAALESLAAEVCRILERQGGGGRCFEAAFFRTDGAVLRIAVDTARPSRDPTAVMRLLTERLSALSDPLDPGFGFDLVRLSVLQVEPLTATQTTFDGSDSSDEETAALADRLGARFGTRAILRYAPSDTHIPERAARAIPVASSTGAHGAWGRPRTSEPPARPLHLFDPPQPVETIAEVPDGPPLRFRWRRVLHEVAMAEGPERIAPEWWRSADDTLTRDYYRIEDSRGRRFWIFREGLYRKTASPRWFIHGLFA